MNIEIQLTTFKKNKNGIWENELDSPMIIRNRDHSRMIEIAFDEKTFIVDANNLERALTKMFA